MILGSHPLREFAFKTSNISNANNGSAPPVVSELEGSARPGYWRKLSGSGLYADVRAASFISRPPPYHENSGPRSVQFGLGPAGGLQLQPQDMNWKLATTSCSKQKTGETETDNWKDRKPAI